MKKTFYTNLCLEECVKRLDDNVKRWDTSNGVYGKRKNMSFWIRHYQVFYSNNFARSYYGKLISLKQGTLIEGEFSITRALKVLNYLIYGFCLMCLIFLIVMYCIGNSKHPVRIEGVVFILFYMVWQHFIVKRGIELGKTEEGYVIDFIKELLEAEER